MRNSVKRDWQGWDGRGTEGEVEQTEVHDNLSKQQVVFTCSAYALPNEPSAECEHIESLDILEWISVFIAYNY